MSNTLMILLGYGAYLALVLSVAGLSWYVEKLDPLNELPESIWDEILPRNRPRQQLTTPRQPLRIRQPLLLPH